MICFAAATLYLLWSTFITITQSESNSGAYVYPGAERTQFRLLTRIICVKLSVTENPLPKPPGASDAWKLDYRIQ